MCANDITVMLQRNQPYVIRQPPHICIYITFLYRSTGKKKKNFSEVLRYCRWNEMGYDNKYENIRLYRVTLPRLLFALLIERKDWEIEYRRNRLLETVPRFSLTCKFKVTTVNILFF